MFFPLGVFFMVKNSAIKLAANKLANSSLLPGSLILIGGLVAWKLWARQDELQIETRKLAMQLKNVKRQIAEIMDDQQKKTDESASSVFRKFFNR